MPVLRPLPDRAAALLDTLDAPPRLVAHLRIVHDVACQLTDWCLRHYPALGFDRQAVLFGAATHDIGKVRHLGEISSPGSAHEQAGYQILRAHGVEEHSARFARTHASWRGSDITTEDLLVSLADKIWRGKREPGLEQLVIDQLAAARGQASWMAFIALDEVLERIAAGAGARLEFQLSHPVSVSAASANRVTRVGRATWIDEWPAVSQGLG